MAPDTIPSYDEFLENGITPVIPEDIPSDSRDRCSGCWEVFGEPGGPDGSIEPLVQFLQCGHIMGRGCFEQWFVSSNKNTCPVCRATLFALDPPDEPRITLLRPSDVSPSRMGVARFNAAASTVLRAQTVASPDALARHMFRLLALRGRGMWPQEYANFRMTNVASCMMDIGHWLREDRRWPFRVGDLERVLMLVAANRMQRDVSAMPGVSFPAEVWARTRAADGDGNVRTTVLTIVHTMLAVAAGFDFIGDEALVVLA